MEYSNSSDDEVSLDMNMIAQSLRRSTNMLKPNLSDDICIYIVPPHLREVNKEMYTPREVSIGPFHHGKKELQAMEEHKGRYLCDFLDRIKTTMIEYIEGLKGLETRLRNSYVEINESYSREEFMVIMALDGAFLIECLLKHYEGGSWDLKDRISRRPGLISDVKNDLLLIENQIPFFYLKHLFGLFKKSMVNVDDNLSLMKIVQHYLNEATPWKWSVDVEIVNEDQVEHLLHFLIICLQQSGSSTTERSELESVATGTPSILQLQEAGVKFKSASSSNCLSNIKFSNGILEIPKLLLADDVEKLFRNMQAFEHCHCSENYIRDYIFIMNALVDNKEDVKVLVRNGIIDNWLEDDRAAAIVFNNLGKGNSIDTSSFCYSGLIEDLNTYYKMRRNKWKAALKQKYFNNPWTIISVIAAAFLMLLTIIQTVCSILQVPRN